MISERKEKSGELRERTPWKPIFRWMVREGVSEKVMFKQQDLHTQGPRGTESMEERRV